MSGQHPVRNTGHIEDLFVEHSGLMSTMANERRCSACEVERHDRLGVCDQTAERLQRMEEVVGPREEIHVMSSRHMGMVISRPVTRARFKRAGMNTLVLHHWKTGHGH